MVNHEYTNEELMFPGLPPARTSRKSLFAEMTPELRSTSRWLRMAVR